MSQLLTPGDQAGTHSQSPQSSQVTGSRSEGWEDTETHWELRENFEELGSLCFGSILLCLYFVDLSPGEHISMAIKETNIAPFPDKKKVS